jgi:hypothetical protein
MLSAFGSSLARAKRRGLSANAAGLLLLGGFVGVAGCGPREADALELRQMTSSFYFTISSNPVPPRAREFVLYKIVVRDRETRQPIETGSGRIYSSNRDEAKTWDLLTKGAEVGTYYGKLNYVTSGDWAVAVEFRRDSTARIEKTEWMQEVFAERATP